jgi:hypothetical protein
MPPLYRRVLDIGCPTPKPILNPLLDVRRRMLAVRCSIPFRGTASNSSWRCERSLPILTLRKKPTHFLIHLPTPSHPRRKDNSQPAFLLFFVSIRVDSWFESFSFCAFCASLWPIHFPSVAVPESAGKNSFPFAPIRVIRVSLPLPNSCLFVSIRGCRFSLFPFVPFVPFRGHSLLFHFPVQHFSFIFSVCHRQLDNSPTFPP